MKNRGTAPLCTSRMIQLFIERVKYLKCIVNTCCEEEHKNRQEKIMAQYDGKKPRLKANKGKQFTPEMLLGIMNRIGGTNQDRDRALFALAYLGGFRIEELVRYTMFKQPWDASTPDDCLGIKRNQISISPDDPTRVTIVNVRCLKRKMLSKKERTIVRPDGSTIVVHSMVDAHRLNPEARLKLRFRKVPIRVNALERPFWNVVLVYTNTVGWDEELFPFSRFNAAYIFAKVGIHPHLLRHVRLTHLVDYYRMSSQHLKQFCGWGSSLSADSYVESSVEAMLNGMVPQ